MSIGKTIATSLIMGAGRMAVNGASRALRGTPAPPVSDPLEGWATPDDLARYAYEPSSFYLGQVDPFHHGLNFEVGLPRVRGDFDDRHVFVVAGNSGGKGTSIILQNCIRWPGGLAVIDPKGQAASYTAMRRGTAEAAKGTGTEVRRFLGQEVAILDPFGMVEGPAKVYRVNYNPLRAINVKDSASGWTRKIKHIADMSVKDGEGSTGASDHFNGNLRIFLAGIIERVMCTRAPWSEKTLPKCSKHLWRNLGWDKFGNVEKDEDGNTVDHRITDEDGLVPWLQRYVDKAPNGGAGFAQRALVVMKEIGEEEWGSMRSTMANKLSWMIDPDLQKHLADSDFSLRRVVQNNGSVFIVVHPDLLGDVSEWLRVIVRQIIQAKSDRGPMKPGELQTL
ncbi:MAG: type IV secretory system conjugative DNA transfer family protein, partial [Pseudomonadota bacterium]